VLIVMVVCFGGWWVVNPSNDEPSYNGHPLSYWAQQVEPDPAGNPYRPVRFTAESAAAVRAIGTNAIPTLLQWMSTPYGGLRAEVLKLTEKNSIPYRARLWLASNFLKSYRPDLAILAFRVLGDGATNAIPSLAQMLHSPLDSRSAVMALCAISTDGAAALTNGFMKINDGTTRANIILQLEHEITPELEPHFAVFLAERLTNDNHNGVQMAVCHVLGTLTNSAEVAVPALVDALNRKQILFPIMALGQFGPAAIPAVDRIQDALTDSNPYVRTNAALALIAIQGTGTGNTNPPNAGN